MFAFLSCFGQDTRDPVPEPRLESGAGPEGKDRGYAELRLGTPRWRAARAIFQVRRASLRAT